ncbi:MAG: hypothetical protein ACM3Q4_02230 [Acidobacteriota bacterium]
MVLKAMYHKEQIFSCGVVNPTFMNATKNKRKVKQGAKRRFAPHEKQKKGEARGEAALRPT